jgi:hypothetical protein
MLIPRIVQQFKSMRIYVRSQAPIEVAAVPELDFLGVEQLAPGQTWEGLLADTWGIPG